MRREKSQPSAAPSLARSVIDKITVHFLLKPSRVDTLARKRLPRLVLPFEDALGAKMGAQDDHYRRIFQFKVKRK